MQNTFHSEPTEPAHHNPYYRNPYEQIPPPPRSSKGHWLYILLAPSLAAIFGSIVFSVLYMPERVIPSTLSISSPIPTSAASREFIIGKTCAGSGPNCSLCAVGVIGHHAVAEFEHPPIFWLADECKSFEYHSPDYFAEPIPQSGIYWWESMPKVCGTYGTEGTTVYDDGSQEDGIKMCHELGITPHCFQYNIAPTLRCDPTPTAQPTQAPSIPPLPTAPPPTPTAPPPIPSSAPYSSDQIYDDLVQAGLADNGGGHDFSPFDFRGTQTRPEGGLIDFQDLSTRSNMSIATFASPLEVPYYIDDYNGAFSVVASVHNCVLDVQNVTNRLSPNLISKYKSVLETYCT